ncbi:molybdopterin-dependent oxidoreductase [Tepidimonas taiwanensis]|uniref:Formate dehydrogenase H n=1 Tax=Tepidimonas taiwanensis TaxID=307486 RepID=A0A554XCL6_9BURK|nr:molybdopterin-dependent oxidoreductase [Tepidimonas taiwanensis]MCX7692993.1 molybdopterin-dependent oxidoreductase [Tepidimonas taiwanensis]MDM7462316.1 molybdopterin-dependent oxidoreductase [Tepidimonas taiwanensis]TSE33573.1 Formate dehydrogenase H [Tepidimonas taiwanensis]UBQ05731.1 molybdopterin-dependent oxidoreductase [Tepidimonas taiwanensis]
MTAPAAPGPVPGAIPGTIPFTLDGRAVTARPGESIWDVARREGTTLPHLCHRPGLPPAGNCRVCVVEVVGERTLAASCCRAPTPGMQVRTDSARAVRARRTVLELLAADAPQRDTLRWDSELAHWQQALGADPQRWPARGAAQQAAQPDTSHPAFTVRLDACIQCTRCVRACRDVQGNDVLGLAGRGAHAHIVFDQDDPVADSTCVACGECVQACPTGALAPANGAYTRRADRVVASVCPFCGVGCAVAIHVKDGRIDRVEGAPGPANDGRLCVKGRFGMDYVHHPQRLTTPLIRRADAPKDPAILTRGPDGRADHAKLLAQFRPATWDEALDTAAAGLARMRDAARAQGLRGRAVPVAGFGSAKGSNEEAYLFQKLIRSAFRTHNVDHCTRLCHASSVAALMEGIGSGAVSNPVRDVAHADFIFVIGANPVQNHPVAATWIKNAVRRGARLVLADPRRTELARHAWRTLTFTPGADVALLNAMLHVIVSEGLVDEAFVAERVHPGDLAALRAHLQAFAPEAMAPLCGIDAATIREVARAYATSPASMIFWGMGVAQHSHGTDNARALIALALLTGQIGRPGTGLHPLRGQNNVQGASDAGLIPMVLPDYHRVGVPEHRAAAEAAWGLPAGFLPDEPGLTVVEILDAAYEGRIRAMLIQGENPAMSDPDAAHAREALARLEHLTVIDIFLTETAALADVVLPATAWPEKTGTVTNTDRTVQLGRPAVAPPGDARADAWILEQLARRLGLAWNYGIDPHGGGAEPGSGIGRVFDEMRGLMPALAGLSWERLLRVGAITHPVPTADDPGHPIVFTDRFPTADGRAHLVSARLSAPAEPPDADYPFVLITGRQLEHWHTGAMTRRSAVLDAIEPVPHVSLHPQTLARLGVAAGGCVVLRSRRGQITVATRADEAVPPDVAFMPFAYAEAAANLLTIPALDPIAKIAEVKYCAVAIEAVPAMAPLGMDG